jgi:hypothetical protein
MHLHAQAPQQHRCTPLLAAARPSRPPARAVCAAAAAKEDAPDLLGLSALRFAKPTVQELEGLLSDVFKG